MTANGCPDRATLGSLVARALEGDGALRVREHIRDCAACRRIAAALQAFERRLGAGLGRGARPAGDPVAGAGRGRTG
jgi:hypothetical protein